MAQIYIVQDLPTDKIDQAFPLMQAVDSHLRLHQWREICRLSESNVADGRRILVASGPRGHFRALCIVEMKRIDGEAPIATVSHLYIDDVLDPDRVAEAMLGALASYCRAQGSARLRITVRGTDETSIVKMAAANARVDRIGIQIEMT